MNYTHLPQSAAGYPPALKYRLVGHFEAGFGIKAAATCLVLTEEDGHCEIQYGGT